MSGYFSLLPVGNIGIIGILLPTICREYYNRRNIFVDCLQVILEVSGYLCRLSVGNIGIVGILLSTLCRQYWNCRDTFVDCL